METGEYALVFGPVPSRRLGRSLGINHIPPKTCSLACVYCQLGRTDRLQIERQAFYGTEAVASAVGERRAAARVRGERIDYLTFVPDGEPTLDAHLGKMISALKSLGIPVAVITNSSLLGDSEVRAALSLADWVSLKMDAADEGIWRKVDRPHGRLRLAEILEGARLFASGFTGRLVTETMLVAGVNDTPEALEATAQAAADLHPSTAYIGVPVRPPAESWVRPPDEAVLNQAFQAFSRVLPRVELLIGYEGNVFASSGDAREDLLSITAVHPMRDDAVEETLSRCSASWDVVRSLVDQGNLVATQYGEHTYYLRSLRP